jgi:hypothetical protein
MKHGSVMPAILYIRRFGCITFAHVPHEKTKKLDSTLVPNNTFSSALFQPPFMAYSTLTAAEFSPHETLYSKKTPSFRNTPSTFPTFKPNSKFPASTIYPHPPFLHHQPTFLPLNLNRH